MFVDGLSALIASKYVKKKGQRGLWQRKVKRKQIDENNSWKKNELFNVCQWCVGIFFLYGDNIMFFIQKIKNYGFFALTKSKKTTRNN
jgi:hypothetical protein